MNIDLVCQVEKYILGLTNVIMLFTQVIRLIINWMTTSVEVVPEEETKSEEQLREEGLVSAAEMRQSVTEFI